MSQTSHVSASVRTPSNGLAKSVGRLYRDTDWPNASINKKGEVVMLRRACWTVSTLIVFGLLIIAHAPARAADAEIDKLLRSPVSKDWVTNGGNLTNNRYSTLKQIDI